ncbi:putative transmembrane alpha-helix domain-containing protein [Rosellinia necatrix]|uniref:Putative transmembrane alpha-helix domain-containing protein n=1 Tax=Rosellinia necatrix TaxID=77044 RepID=A0A1S7UNY0_ROSNE|nr:putative transmembrane alpha-helix domain-containing protein [Rosellinia necatrix]
MSVRQITTMAMLALASFASAQKGVEVPAEQPVTGTDTVAGCFSSLGDMTLDSTDKYNAQGYCGPVCREKGKPVGATYLKNCYCGTKMPNHKTLLDDSKCNEPCPGFDLQACGGLNAYTVYNTGVQVNVEEADLDETSTSSAPSSTSTSQTSASGTATNPAQTEDPTNKDESKPNTVGIAVGVVVGVIVVSAIAAGAFFYVRRKKNAELEEEHRRNAAVNAFITGGKPPRSSGGMSIADSRMDPVMNRRMSDGSIADNQDYSRRILRVTNA